MSNPNTSKADEGLELVRAAEKSLKTSFFKWRADYESAAESYGKAATCFRNAKAYEQCKACLIKAADCHKHNRSLFYAAKALDQAVLICKELDNFSEIPMLAERAANMFQTQGNAESAAATLDKSAKIIEGRLPAEALRLFQHAADIAMIQDNPRQAAEYVSKVARINVKLRQYDAAAEAIRRELGLLDEAQSYQALGRLAVAFVLVQLARGDVVAAEKAFKEWGNCCEAPEVQTLEALLQAYDDEDTEGAKRALNCPFIKHMDIEYSILARDMPLPQASTMERKSSLKEKAPPSPGKQPKSSKKDTDGADQVNIEASGNDNEIPNQEKNEDDEDSEGIL